MSKLVTLTTVAVGIFAFLLTFYPSLRAFVPYLETPTHETSEADLQIQALASSQKYTATTIFTDPLVVYLDDFLSTTELEGLLNISTPLFTPSLVFNPDTTAPQHRTSSSCLLPQDAPLPSTISTRALQFLSSSPSLESTPLSYYGLEPLQAVKYGPSQYYHHHVDYFDALIRDVGPRGKQGGGQFYNRVASFFLYLEDACVGGGTEFPDLKWGNVDESFKRIFMSGNDEKAKAYWDARLQFSEEDGGVTFKPRKGSGVFWVNLDEVGFGSGKVSHAGLLVEEGEKVGMNIWVKRSFGW